MHETKPNGNGRTAWLKAWIAPALIIAMISLGTSFLGAYGGRQRAAGETQTKLAEVIRQQQQLNDKLDKMNDRIGSDCVSKELYKQFVDSQRDSYQTIGKQLGYIQDHLK